MLKAFVLPCVRNHGSIVRRSTINQLVSNQVIWGTFSEKNISSSMHHSLIALLSPDESSWLQFTFAHAKPSFFRITRLMTSGIYNDYSQGYHSPFKVIHRLRFFRVLLKLTSAEWTQVQSTALETLMRLGQSILQFPIQVKLQGWVFENLT